MFFHVEHTTQYVYSGPAVEAFSELRMRPRESMRQRVLQPSTRLDPAVPIDGYTDFFGNFVEAISIPFRHTYLTVTSTCNVVTNPFADALSGLDLTLEEARHLYRPRARELYDYLRPSPLVPFTRSLRDLAAKLLPSTANFATALKHLNSFIFTEFKYVPGATHVSTNVAEFIEKKEGVCQDFAHLLICLCRNAGIPARYVSGYIESSHDTSADKTTLIGAAASHAWVEVFTPNYFWVGLDPTNNMLEGERHIQIGIGRDYRDVPPLRGVFKGPQRQTLSVAVSVTRG